MTLHWRRHLATNRAAEAAEGCERKKINDYRDKINERTGEFLPFIMETQGGVEKAAKKFILEFDKRKNQR